MLSEGGRPRSAMMSPIDADHVDWSLPSSPRPSNLSTRHHHVSLRWCQGEYRLRLTCHDASPTDRTSIDTNSQRPGPGSASAKPQRQVLLPTPQQPRLLVDSVSSPLRRRRLLPLDRCSVVLSLKARCLAEHNLNSNSSNNNRTRAGCLEVNRGRRVSNKGLQQVFSGWDRAHRTTTSSNSSSRTG